jgi:NADH-quinone oxidoreductase subunit A
MFNINYFYFFIFLIICFFISIIFLIIPLLVAPKNTGVLNKTPYECGFQSTNFFFYRYNLHFYTIGMLFLIFDLELLYIIPWCLLANSLPFFSFWYIVIFVLILLFGFFYEWKKKIIFLKK